MGRLNPESLIRTLSECRQAAVECGIYHALSLGYGTFLGMIRENNFIKHDDDMDLVILADKITKEQEDAYLKKLQDIGLFNERHKYRRRKDTGRLLWTTMKRTSSDTKCCSWYFQRHGPYYFHGKGRDWVKEKIGPRLEPPINPLYDGILKGIPANLFDRMIEREFVGMKFMVPLRYGMVLDYWYPNFSIPRGGSSLEDMLLIVPKWSEPKNWHYRKRPHKYGF